MNKHLLFIALLTVGLIACSGGSTTKEKNTDTAAQEAKSVEKVKEAATGMDDIKEALGKLSPMSADDLKKLLPVQLDGAAAENTEVENSSGVNIATADYKVTDTTALTLSIIDCAGPAGVGIYTTQHLGMAATEGETEDEYTKSVTVNGSKGYEHCSKEDKDCSLVWFTGNRYLISIEGAASDKLKQLASEIKIK